MRPIAWLLLLALGAIEGLPPYMLKSEDDAVGSASALLATFVTKPTVKSLQSTRDPWNYWANHSWSWDANCSSWENSDVSCYSCKALKLQGHYERMLERGDSCIDSVPTEELTCNRCEGDDPMEMPNEKVNKHYANPSGGGPSLWAWCGQQRELDPSITCCSSSLRPYPTYPTLQYHATTGKPIQGCETKENSTDLDQGLPIQWGVPQNQESAIDASKLPEPEPSADAQKTTQMSDFDPECLGSWANSGFFCDCCPSGGYVFIPGSSGCLLQCPGGPKVPGYSCTGEEKADGHAIKNLTDAANGTPRDEETYGYACEKGGPCLLTEPSLHAWCGQQRRENQKITCCSLVYSREGAIVYHATTGEPIAQQGRDQGLTYTIDATQLPLPEPRSISPVPAPIPAPVPAPVPVIPPVIPTKPSKVEMGCDAKCAKIKKWDWPTKCTWKNKCGGCPECKV